MIATAEAIEGRRRAAFFLCFSFSAPPSARSRREA